MKRIAFLSSIAGLALVVANPALAAPGGGHGGSGGNPGAGATTIPSPAGGIGQTGSDARDLGRMNSQGPEYANPRAVERTNSNSVLSTQSTTGPTATTVRGKAEANVKASVNAGTDQPATARAKSRGAANASVNGLAHASEKSALGAAGSTQLKTVAAGTTITGSGGASVGTVNSLVVNRSGAVVGVKVDVAGGGTVTIPASQLTLTGTTLTTTFVPGK